MRGLGATSEPLRCPKMAERQPLPLAKYNYATELFDLSIPIVEKLYRCVTGKGFSIAQSRKIRKKCAEALWKGCKFVVERY